MMSHAEPDVKKAFFYDGLPMQLSTRYHVRAPEALYNQLVDKHADVWNMGCLVSAARP